MKVYTCIEFKGHEPTGVAAVIVCRGKKTALRLLTKKLSEEQLAQDPDEPLTLDDIVELDTETPAVVILQDGDY